MWSERWDAFLFYVGLMADAVGWVAVALVAILLLAMLGSPAHGTKIEDRWPTHAKTFEDRWPPELRALAVPAPTAMLVPSGGEGPSSPPMSPRLRPRHPAPPSTTQCEHAPPHAAAHWMWRLIDGRRCWYAGRKLVPKSRLHWAQTKTMTRPLRKDISASVRRLNQRVVTIPRGR